MGPLVPHYTALLYSPITQCPLYSPITQFPLYSPITNNNPLQNNNTLQNSNTLQNNNTFSTVNKTKQYQTTNTKKYFSPFQSNREKSTTMRYQYQKQLPTVPKSYIPEQPPIKPVQKSTPKK